MYNYSSMNSCTLGSIVIRHKIYDPRGDVKLVQL